MAKKKSIARTRSRRQPTTRSTVEVFYGCWDGACDTSDDALHAAPGDVVVMSAVGVEVSIKFPSGSPFQSGAGASAPIVLPAGQSQAEIIKLSHPTNPAKYKYNIKCKPNCGSHAGQPEMIVP